ncbi:MAG: SMC-Scp complex subunit ScpB, partial [Clostridia bacterium]|nr:SMC-Scp complex subunit ScpB [Clostridia bacterium]
TALGIRRGGNLSPSSLEVLAIVAYNQPVTRAFIDTVRGVDSSYAVSSMVEKKLIEPCGRLDVPGRPMLYKTTDNFLRVFGLTSLTDLPDVKTPDGDVMSAGDDSVQLKIIEE